jgi:O-antigen/teichoic acid export membrane protein
MMIAQNRIAEVRQPLEHLLAAVLETSLFGCLQLVAFADVVMRLWVGRGFAERIDVIQILCLAIPAYLLYAVLRSFIDAASVKAYNARNIIIALACFLVLTGTGIGLAPRRLLLEAIAGALLAALAVLALLTSETVCSLYGLRMHWSRCLPSIVWSAGLFGGAVLSRHCAGLLDNLAGQIAVETAAAGLFGVVLVKSRTPWLMYFREMVLPKRELVYSAPSC